MGDEQDDKFNQYMRKIPILEGGRINTPNKIGYKNLNNDFLVK